MNVWIGQTLKPSCGTIGKPMKQKIWYRVLRIDKACSILRGYTLRSILEILKTPLYLSLSRYKNAQELGWRGETGQEIPGGLNNSWRQFEDWLSTNVMSQLRCVVMLSRKKQFSFISVRAWQMGIARQVYAQKVESVWCNSTLLLSPETYLTSHAPSG